MTLQDIKELVAEEGGRVIIVERDAIVAVVLSHEAYKALKGKTPPKPAPFRSEPVVSEPPLADIPDFEEPDELTIDDLPL